MSNEKRLWIIEARDGAWGANGICKGELVRCRECKYRQESVGGYFKSGYFCERYHILSDMENVDDWFCADGERRTE